MPFKDPEAQKNYKRRYMRDYMRRQRGTKPVVKPVAATEVEALKAQLAKARTEIENLKQKRPPGEIDPGTLSMTAQEKLAAAIRQHTKRLNQAYEQQVHQEVRRRIVAADDATRKQNKELREENLAITQMLHRRGVFSKKQFNQLKILCHPDNSASPQLRAELLQIILENECVLIKPEKK